MPFTLCPSRTYELRGSILPTLSRRPTVLAEPKRMQGQGAELSLLALFSRGVADIGGPLRGCVTIIKVRHEICGAGP